MKTLKKFFQYIMGIGMVVILFTPMTIAQGAGITHYPKLINAAFWQSITPSGDVVLLQDAEKNKFNQEVIAKSSCMVNLKEYPMIKAAAQIRTMVADLSVLDDTLYDSSGEVLSESDKAALKRQLNLEALSGTKTLMMGVVVRRANLRNLPTAQPIFDIPVQSMFDRLQETAVDPSEPVVILHTSSTGEYYYVQMYNYRGWIAAKDVAIVRDRASWLQYVVPKEFLVVIEKAYSLPVDNEQLLYQMGSRLPVISKTNGVYNVRVPQRNAAGLLTEKIVSVDASTALSDGYLPYTRNQLLRAAFQYLGEPYGWGGLADSVDCSSFINNIYRTVGIILPRNADEQEMTAGQHFALASLNTAGVYQSIHQNLKAGDTLHMDGHVMMYLGEVNGIPYVIHALGSHTEHYDDGSKEKQRVLKVVVSDLSLKTWSGYTFVDALTNGVSFH